MASSYDWGIQWFIANRLWDLVPYYPAMILVSCKLVFRVKEKSDGNVESYKEVLVADGYKKQHTLNYDETFNSVIKSKSIWIVVSLAISVGWIVRQLDVKECIPLRAPRRTCLHEAFQNLKHYFIYLLSCSPSRFKSFALPHKIVKIKENDYF